MKKVLLTITATLILISCTTKTRTVTPHLITVSDSLRVVVIKEKANELFGGINLVNRCTDKLRKGRLDSAELVQLSDSIVMSVNSMTVGLQPINDTVYSNN